MRLGPSLLTQPHTNRSVIRQAASLSAHHTQLTFHINSVRLYGAKLNPQRMASTLEQALKQKLATIELSKLPTRSLALNRITSRHNAAHPDDLAAHVATLITRTLNQKDPQ